jgi:hypothetical protein
LALKFLPKKKLFELKSTAFNLKQGMLKSVTCPSSELTGVAGFAGLDDPEVASAWVVEVGSSRLSSDSSLP